jgi:Ca-activated chloride channel homolog
VTLLAPWGLLAVAVLVVLVLAHLRRRRRAREVSSLLLWTEPGEGPAPLRRDRAALVLPWLLALQAVAVVVLAVALARPVHDAGRTSARPVEVFVVDASLAMRPVDRMRAARAAVDARLAALPAGTRAALVVAGDGPGLVVAPTGDRDRVRAAAAGLRAGYARADLATALRVAGGLLATSRDRVWVLHARETPVPRIAGVRSTARALGAPLDDQAIEDAVARCAPAAPADCRLRASVRNDAGGARTDTVEVRDGARVLVRQAVRVAAHARTGVVLRVPAGARLSVALAGADDSLPEDDAARVVVPAPSATAVTLVSDGGRTSALARALTAAPGARLRLVTPAAYRRAGAGADAARATDVLVLDRVAAGAPLPAVPSVLLVAPPALAGARTGPALADAAVTTTAAGDPLLAGVDLTGLVIDAGAARRLAPPAGLRAVVSAAGGPLLSAGILNGQRIAVLAFAPQRSTLPGLAAFPTLVANVVAWGGGGTTGGPSRAGDAWAIPLPAGTSATVAPGSRVLHAPAGGGVVALPLDRPGLVTVTRRGAWGSRAETAAVTVAAPGAATAGAPVTLRAPTASATSGARSERWPWLVALALAVLVAEALVALRIRRNARVPA